MNGRFEPTQTELDANALLMFALIEAHLRDDDKTDSDLDALLDNLTRREYSMLFSSLLANAANKVLEHCGDDWREWIARGRQEVIDHSA